MGNFQEWRHTKYDKQPESSCGASDEADCAADERAQAGAKVMQGHSLTSMVSSNYHPSPAAIGTRFNGGTLK